MQIPDSGRIVSSINRQDTIIIQEKNREGAIIRRYSRGRFLGKGGFARCYEMTSLEDNKKYAVKLIQKASLTRSKAREKLNSQIKIHKAMKSEYVVGFNHFFEDQDNVYILLQICSNQTLNELIKRRKRITEIQAKYYLHQIISGVKHIHNSNVIHRDLKLGNLFLTDKLQIKIGDFGLAAKLTSNFERRKTMCGTPNYIAPEILENNGHSFEVDIWSIGVIAYAFVCGRPPFQTNDVKCTYQKIKSCNYSFPDSINLSLEIKQLISKMLMRDPSRRATIHELLNEDFFTKSSFPEMLPTSLLSHPPNTAFIKQYSERDFKQTHEPSTQSHQKAKNSQPLTNRFEKQSQKDSLERVIVRAQSNERLDQRNHAIQRACSTNVLMHKKKSFSKQKMGKALLKQCEGQVVWVTYFESNPKFGVSYILNSNAIGMKFNDSTYMISNSNFTKLKYQSSSQTEKDEIFELGRNPQSLNKKVKIICHYEKQLNKRKQQEEGIINNEQRINRQKLRFRQNNETALSVWVVKHQATSKVTMFWFNNKDQQFIFKDHTQILISNEKYVTYVNKVSERKYFSIADINQQTEDIKKRINYTNFILQNISQQNALTNIQNQPNRDNLPTLTRSSSMAKVDKIVQPVLVRSNSTLNRLQSYKNLR